MLFPVLEPEIVIGDLEQLGTKEKFWFSGKNDGELDSLFKFSREDTGEHWSEKCAAELCDLLEIPHAHYDIAKYKNRFGVITRNIIPANFRMVMGNEVLHSKTTGYPVPLQTGEKPVSVRQHTITRVLGCLDNESILPPPVGNYDLGKLNAAGVFCGYLMLDALISNQDRHHENWAIMLNNDTGEQFLCPTYDHAASLGREMRDEELKKRLETNDKGYQIPFFVRKARSQLYRVKADTLADRKQKPLTPVEAFQCAVEDRDVARDHWLAKLRALTENSITGVFNRVPKSCITEYARTFAIEMVMENRRRLLE